MHKIVVSEETLATVVSCCAKSRDLTNRHPVMADIGDELCRIKSASHRTGP